MRAQPVGNAQPHNTARRRSDTGHRRLLRDRGSHTRLLVVISLVHGSLNQIYGANDIGMARVCRVRSCDAIFRLISAIRKRLRRNLRTLSYVGTTFPNKSVANTPGVETVRIVSRVRPARHGICAKSVNCIKFGNSTSLGVIVQAVLRGKSATCFRINNNVI